MQWYRKAVKRIVSGVVFFLLPIVLLVFILGKAVAIVQHLIQPIKQHLPAGHLLGVGLITLISLFVILFICYLAGDLSERKRARILITKLEDNVLVFIPGYAMIKSRARDEVEQTDHKWCSVLVEDNDTWRPGIGVDRQPDGYCSVFFPESPDARSGEIKLMHESKLRRLQIPVSNLVKVVRKYGEGSAAWMSEETFQEKIKA